MEEGGNCSTYVMEAFAGQQNLQMIRVNGLIVVNAILAGILVGIGAYGPRYRRRAFIRFIFQGANTLFLPILSYVVSNGSTAALTIPTTNAQPIIYDFFIPNENRHETLQPYCRTLPHFICVLLWALLVQIVGMNTCAVVAADDREGRNVRPSLVFLVQATWTSYLVAYKFTSLYFEGSPYFDASMSMGIVTILLLYLLFTKMLLKHYAFQMARRSFALGRSPSLIVGHMETSQETCQHAGAGPTVQHLHPPALIVTGEDKQSVETRPHGYCIRNLADNLVTIDKVWQLDDVTVRSIPQIKDLCFSFALFKLLRCRFADYTVAEAGFMKTHNFFWHVLFEDRDAEEVFRVIQDELTFLQDYYYSSLPISYSKSWLPIVNILISLLTIIFCLLMGLLAAAAVTMMLVFYRTTGQITCGLLCNEFINPKEPTEEDIGSVQIGNKKFDMLPLLLLSVLVVLVEAREIASYVCSNWTKVSLICRYAVNRETWQQSPWTQKWVSRVVRCSCKLMKHWDDRMNQCSVLELHPRKAPIALVMRLLRLPDRKKNVMLPRVVKAAIVEALKSSNGMIQCNFTDVLRRVIQPEDGTERFLWACDGEGNKVADTILVWHVATSILEMRRPVPQSSDDKIVATHLSQYCAYLVAYVPGLLQDEKPWCKKLYKAAKKDSMRVLASGGVSASTATADELVNLLAERSEQEVLKKGANLGKELVDLAAEEGEETAWRVLAGFWSAMILHVAPSGRLDEHAEAVARGGELVTLLWALLMHAGPRPASGTADTV